MTPRQTLMQLLKRNKLLVAPGCFDGLSARLVQESGFEAAYLSGGAVARSMGIPDIGLVTMSETIERAAQVVSAITIPVIADADTGYGGLLNIRRTVQGYEAAGAAAIQLEYGGANMGVPAARAAVLLARAAATQPPDRAAR